MILNDKLRGQAGQYVGLLNGVWCQMDANMKFVPLDVSSPAAEARLTPGMSLGPSDTDPKLALISPVVARPGKVDVGRSEREERGIALFRRDGGEALRAGHPDLWNLLVAGTCLEGSTFQSGLPSHHPIVLSLLAPL